MPILIVLEVESLSHRAYHIHFAVYIGRVGRPRVQITQPLQAASDMQLFFASQDDYGQIRHLDSPAKRLS